MLLPVGPLAVPAAVLDEAAAGAARQGGLVALAVGAGVGVVAGGGLLLLGWHGFGRRGEKTARGLGNPSNPRSRFSLHLILFRDLHFSVSKFVSNFETVSNVKILVVNSLNIWDTVL